MCSSLHHSAGCRETRVTAKSKCAVSSTVACESLPCRDGYGSEQGDLRRMMRIVAVAMNEKLRHHIGEHDHRGLSGEERNTTREDLERSCDLLRNAN
jgi:hypothetical protein